MKLLVHRLHEAGVHIYAGSDTFNPFVVPGASLQEELYHLIDAGFTPEEVWAAATREAGEWLREPRLGSVEEGAPADLLIFREDPTRDLAALSTLEAVVAQGRLYPKEMLDQALARWRAHFEGRFYDTVTMAIARRRMRQFASNR
jgi:imidazolonepropionase-like amidohydrolase